MSQIFDGVNHNQVGLSETQMGEILGQGIFHVRAYGAQGKGQSDDTSAIQDAINAVPSSGGIVYGDGRFKITSTITMKPRVRLEGPVGQYRGAGQQQGFQFLWAGANDGTMMTYLDSPYCEMRGVNFDGGSGDGITGVTAILIDSDNDPHVYSLDFSDFGIQRCTTGIKINTSGVTGTQSSDIRLSNFEISELDMTSGKGIHTNSQNVDNVIIEMGRFYNLRYGIYMERVGFLNIRNCTAGFDTGVGDFIWASIHGNLLIENCQAETGGGYFLLIPSSAPANTQDMITLISNTVDLGIDIQVDRGIVSIGNRYNADFTLSGDSERVISIGDIFTSTYDFLLTGTNPSVDRIVTLPTADYYGLDHYHRNTSGYNRPKMTMHGWLSDSTQTVTLGAFTTDCYVTNVHIQVTELFNSNGTDNISVGVTGDHEYFATNTDVSSTGIKTVTLGTGADHEASPTAVVAYYANGGTEPTTGKALVILEYVKVSAEIA